MPTLSDWQDLRVRIGTIVRAEPNRGSRDPAFALWIDFGEVELQSSAKITDRYSAEQLIGRQVVAVTGFDSLRVGGFRSDCLVLGALTADGVVLLAPDSPVAPGAPVA